MLDTKDTLILEFFFKYSSWQSSIFISNSLNITISQLNYHMEHINTFLKKANIDKIKLSSKKINNIELIKSYYRKYIKSNEILYLSKDDRRNIMKLLIAFCDNFSINFFSKMFKTTHNTIFSDFNQIKIDIQNYKFNSLNFFSSNKGYKLEGNADEVHIFLINELIDFINNDHNESLLYFILNNINYDDYSLLKLNNISRIDLYSLILKKVYKLFEQITYINLQPKTLAVLIYILFVKKLDKSIKSISSNISNKYFAIASNFIDNLKDEFSLNVKIGINEKYYLSYLLSSWVNIIPAECSSDNVKLAKNLYNDFKIYFEKQGWEIHDFKESSNFYKYIIWTKESFTYRVRRYQNVDFQIAKLVCNNDEQKYYNCFYNCFFEFKDKYKYSYRSSFIDMFKLYFINIKHFPKIIDVKEIYLITDHWGALISQQINTIRKNIKNIEEIHIINAFYYKKHKEEFEGLPLITNIKELKEIKYLLTGTNIILNC